MAFYVNGLLAPELNLVRGKTYTFVVETGLGANSEGIFQPFYITTSNEGGYQIKSEQERKYEEVFAGVVLDRNENPIPNGLGRLCQWKQMVAGDLSLDNLQLECPPERDQNGLGGAVPGVFTFVPNRDMPDMIFYQVKFIRFQTKLFNLHSLKVNCFYYKTRKMFLF